LAEPSGSANFFFSFCEMLAAPSDIAGGRLLARDCNNERRAEGRGAFRQSDDGLRIAHPPAKGPDVAI